MPSVTVSKAPQTITFNALANKTFGDAPFTVSATGGGSGNPVTFALGANSKGCSVATSNGITTVTITGATATGEQCIIVASQAGNNNYLAAESVSQSFTIAKASQTITFNALGSKKFGDAPFTVSATGGDSGNPVTFAVKHATDKCTVSGTQVTITGAGSCTIVASQAGNANYEAATSVERMFQITKADAVLSLSNNTYTYDGAAKQVTASTTPAGLEVVTVTYSKDGQAVATPTNAGTYTVRVTLTNDNYAAPEIVNGQLVIHPKQLTGAISAANKTYDGGTTATATAQSLSGVVAGDAVTLEVSNAQFDNKNVGARTVTANIALSGADASNYSLSSTTASDSANITPKTITLDITAGDKEYDGTTTATASAKLPLEGVVGGDKVMLDISNARFDSKDAGVRTVTANIALSGADAGNYSLSSTTASDSATINQRSITVTADPQSKTYGAADQDLTYQVTSGELVAGDKFSGALSRAAGETVLGGPYAIQQGTLTAGPNYALTFVNAGLTITKANATIKADGYTVTYNGQTHSLTGTATGALNENLSSLLTFDGSFTNVPGGIATWNFQGDVNHVPASGEATITITKAGSITTVSVEDGTYNGKPQGGSAEVTGVGGLKQPLTVTYEGTAFDGTTYGPSETAPTKAGDYTASASYDGDTNHRESSRSESFSIAKANATIKVTGYTVTYDGKAHSLTGTATSADGTTNLSGLLTFTGSFTDVPGGTATWSFAGDDNHNKDSGTATITISKASSSVSIKNLPSSATVGGSFTPTFAVVGDGTTSVTSLTPSICSVSSGVVSYVAAGECTLQAAITAGTNYEAATGEAQSFWIANPVSSCGYTASFQAPIQNNVRNLAKLGNVVPVKVTLTDCNGQVVTNQTLFITVVTGTNNTALDANVAVTESVSSADSGQQLRLSDSTYMYNLSTKGLTSGTDYTIRIHEGSTSGKVIVNAVLQPRK